MLSLFLVAQRAMVSESVFIFKQLQTQLTLMGLGVLMNVSHMNFHHSFLSKFFQAIGTTEP